MTERRSSPPKVSVLMAAYNAERYLRKALDSILAQTYTDFELIVVDDGSSDGTYAVLSACQDTRLRIVRLPRNRGLTAALNLGLSQARGCYIARMDADDISLPDRFLRQVEWLDRHPETTVLGTSALRIDSDDRFLENMVSAFRSSEEVGRSLAAGMCPVIHSSVLARTEVLRSMGGYRTQFPHAEDFDLWLRVLDHGRVFILPEPLLMYRSSSGSIRLTRIVEATQSHEYALDCCRRRATGLNERDRNEFLDATDLTQAEAQRFWSLALETLMLGDADSALGLSAEVLRRVPTHDGARVLHSVLTNPAPLPVASLYRQYRRTRGWVGSSPLGPYLRDFKHRSRPQVGKTNAP